jgi:hypothetical protein
MGDDGATDRAGGSEFSISASGRGAFVLISVVLHAVSGIAIVGGQYTATNAAVQPQQFYRLKKVKKTFQFSSDAPRRRFPLVPDALDSRYEPRREAITRLTRYPREPIFNRRHGTVHSS